MSFPLVASVNRYDWGTVSTLTQDSAVSYQSGDLIVAAVSWQGFGIPSSFAVTDGMTPLSMLALQGAGGYKGSAIGWAVATSAGSAKIYTLTPSSGLWRMCFTVMVFRPPTGTLSLDDYAGVSGSTTTGSRSTAAIDTTGSDELVLALFEDYNDSTWETPLINGATATSVKNQWQNTLYAEVSSPVTGLVAQVTPAAQSSPWTAYIAAFKVVSSGGVTVEMAGIPSAEAHGSASIGASVALSGVASEEAHGSATISPTVSVSGVASAEAHGSQAIGAVISAAGIPSAEAHGSFSLIPTISMVGIPSAEAHGQMTISVAVAGTISMLGIPSAESHGAASISAGITAAGVATAEAHGAAVISPAITMSGIASQEAHGQATLRATISLSGVPSAEAHGLMTITPEGPATVSMLGIASAEAHGLMTITWVGTEPPFLEAEVLFRVQVEATLGPVAPQSMTANFIAHTEATIC